MGMYDMNMLMQTQTPKIEKQNGGLNFRILRADEVECRISTATENGVSLLLYKDARCDMNILDETVGAMNWTREHTRDNANCIVSIWDDYKQKWVSKEDTGTESQSEAEKGLASDSFKRACFNWGIGRELYTAPFIWIPADKVDLFQKNGKWTSRDRFKLSAMYVNEKRKICYLEVWNMTKRIPVLRWGQMPKTETETETETTATENTGNNDAA